MGASVEELKRVAEAGLGVKPFSEEHRRILDGVAILIYRTTWKCGKWERKIVSFLLRNFGRAEVKRFFERYGPFSGKAVYYVVDAFENLERRRIIRIEEGFPLDEPEGSEQGYRAYGHHRRAYEAPMEGLRKPELEAVVGPRGDRVRHEGTQREGQGDA